MPPCLVDSASHQSAWSSRLDLDNIVRDVFVLWRHSRVTRDIHSLQTGLHSAQYGNSVRYAGPGRISWGHVMDTMEVVRRRC